MHSDNIWQHFPVELGVLVKSPPTHVLQVLPQNGALICVCHWYGRRTCLPCQLECVLAASRFSSEAFFFCLLSHLDQTENSASQRWSEIQFRPTGPGTIVWQTSLPNKPILSKSAASSLVQRSTPSIGDFDLEYARMSDYETKRNRRLPEQLPGEMYLLPM